MFLTNGSNVFAIDSVTQSNVWTYQFEGGETATSQPTADSGIVLIGTSVGNVYSFDQTMGKIVWVYKTGLNTPVYSAPNYTWNDRVIFGCGNVIFNIDYDRTPPYNRTQTYTAVSNIAGSFATAFDPSGNLWCYYTASDTLFGVSMLDDSGNYVGWSSTDTDMTPGVTPTMDPNYVYVTSEPGVVRQYSAFPSGLVQNSIVQKGCTLSYAGSLPIHTPSVVTTACNQLVVFGDYFWYIFQ
jgi:outer membrane protein assembly factor BamB